jgi:hypothetical protein
MFCVVFMCCKIIKSLFPQQYRITLVLPPEKCTLVCEALSLNVQYIPWVLLIKVQ